MKALLIAQFTLREASRKKAVLGGVVLTIVFLLLYAVGTYFAFREMRAPPNVRQMASSFLLLAGIYFVNFIGGLLAIFSAVGTISGEIEQGTLHAIVPKPLHRWEIVAGKYLGLAVIVAVYVIVTSVASILIVSVQSGYWPAQAAPGILLILLGALLLLALSVLGTIKLSTVANGIIVFMLFAFAMAGGRIGQLGSLLHLDTLVNIGTITSFLIPSDTIWQLAASMFSGRGSFASSGLQQPTLLFTGPDVPSIWMAAYGVCYTLSALVAGVLLFRRRDL